MSKAKKIEEIKVRLILEVLRKLEEESKKQAEVLTSVRERLECLDLEQTIAVLKPFKKRCGGKILNLWSPK